MIQVNNPGPYTLSVETLDSKGLVQSTIYLVPGDSMTVKLSQLGQCVCIRPDAGAHPDLDRPRR